MILVDFFINAFKDWISIFTAPLQNVDMLWILIPVYLGWAFTEFYQEKKGTSFGNAVSNGIIVLWVGMDWTRTTFNLVRNGSFTANSFLYTKFAIAAVMFFYGLFIIVNAIKTSSKTSYLGRIRLVTYAILMFTPIFYDAIPITFSVIISMVIFFPLFYVIVEILDFIIPDPKALQEDLTKQQSEQQVQLNQYQQYGQQYPGYGQYYQYPQNQQYPGQQQNQYPPQYGQNPNQQYPNQYPDSSQRKQ